MEVSRTIAEAIANGADRQVVLRLLPALNEALTAAEQRYVIERERLRYPKDKEYTELDRKVMLDAAVAELYSDWQSLARLWQLALLFVER